MINVKQQVMSSYEKAVRDFSRVNVVCRQQVNQIAWVVFDHVVLGVRLRLIGQIVNNENR